MEAAERSCGIKACASTEMAEAGALLNPCTSPENGMIVEDQSMAENTRGQLRTGEADAFLAGMHRSVDGLLRNGSFSKYCLGGLSTPEASALLFTCKRVMDAMKPFLAGMAFAATRPKILTNGPPLDLQQWMWLWESCAASVCADGLDPALLVKAETASKTEQHWDDQSEDEWVEVDRHYTCGMFNKGDPYLCKFLEMSLNPGVCGIKIVPESHAHNHTKGDGQISAVLAVTSEERFVVFCDDSQQQKRYCKRINTALVATSHCQVALVEFSTEEDTRRQIFPNMPVQGGVVYLGKDPSQVFCIARESGARARWKPCDERSYNGMVNLHLDGLFSVFKMKSYQSRFSFCQPKLDPDLQMISRRKSTSKDRAMLLLRQSRAWVSARTEAQLAPEHQAAPFRCAEKEFEVGQSIEHNEPPTVREPLPSDLQADEERASSVEMRLHGGCAFRESSGVDKPEAVWLLQFKSHSREFKEALCDGIPLRACREALVAEHHPFVLPDSEAKVFIKPEQWESVMSSVREHELRPYHVIVTSSYEHMVTECLMDVPYLRCPRLEQPMSTGRKLLTIEADSKTIGENTLAEVDAQSGLWRALTLISVIVAACSLLLHAVMRVD